MQWANEWEKIEKSSAFLDYLVESDSGANFFSSFTLFFVQCRKM